MYKNYYIPSSPLDSFLKFIITIAIILFIIWAIAFWIKMIVHLMNSKSEDKVAWVLILLSTNIIGALIYYGVVINKPQEKPKIQNNKKSS
ncbi:MAG TPA: PLDc N-terminal domain-containing protein [bacterium]|nr:PLDc N-terminal domain-containing protein [bacterium]